MSTETKPRHDLMHITPGLVVGINDLRPNVPRQDSVLGVWKGEPWHIDAAGKEQFFVPDVPYVFKARLQVNQADNDNKKTPEPITMLLAHGQRNAAGEWTFRDGRGVRSVVDRYNLHNIADPIRCVAVCNSGSTSNEAEVTGAVHATGSDLTVKGSRTSHETTVAIGLKDPIKGKFHLLSERMVAATTER